MHRRRLIVMALFGALFAGVPSLAHAQAGPPSSGACPCPMVTGATGAVVTVTDTENGAAILFTPNDPAQLEALRAQVRLHAQHLQQGICPMMGGTAPPATAPPRYQHMPHRHMPHGGHR